MSTESKKHEDIPENVTRRVLRIFPDFGIHGDAYLWDLNGVCIDAEKADGTPELARRFEEWSYRWDEITTANDYETDRATLAAEQFDEKGLALATELKRAVGDKSRVIYELLLTDGAVEVQADGNARDWPLGVDIKANRKWALAQNPDAK